MSPTAAISVSSAFAAGRPIVRCGRAPSDIGPSTFAFRFHSAQTCTHLVADLGWAIAAQKRQSMHRGTVPPTLVLTVRLADGIEDLDATLAEGVSA